MKKYTPILLLLAIVLFFVTDHLKLDPSKNKGKVKGENSTPSPTEDHEHSEGSDSDHSDPENIKRMAIFHFNEGNKSLRQEKWEDAEKNYQKALRHNREFQETYINLSTTYFRAKKFDEALKTLQELEQINASNPLLHYNLACYYSLTNQPEASLDALKNAVGFGYKNFQEIQTDPDLESLRTKAGFKAWFLSIQSKS
ncbi:MAG: tetratricopeptide repeat protein [Nitrospinae bacterium]|jgi:tetratricopeptide (TPR) repeat protein|nr:tetratricopeptide repeat protein [Nitrospinota bacterium]MDA1108640.1 tetratricopeptide repeat protein [Nitrospinota bacterium]